MDPVCGVVGMMINEGGFHTLNFDTTTTAMVVVKVTNDDIFDI